MRRLLAIYRAQFKVAILQQWQYRTSAILWQLGMILEPVIYLVIWSTIARLSGGEVDGYTEGNFAAYFLVLLLVNHLTDNWVYYEFQERVQQGLLSPLLLRPVHPIHADLAKNLANKLLMLIVMLPATGVLALMFHPTAHITPLTVLAFFPALALAIAIRFVVEWILGLVAFWTTQMTAVIQMYYVALFFLSGQMGPIALFPAPLQVLAYLLPFQWMLAFPVELVLGHLTLQQIVLGFCAQGTWLALSAGLLIVLWRNGLRRYTGVGA
jgi:ABC-2 type transport system permease protein